MANGTQSFLYMVNNLDNITDPNHPSKTLRGNAANLSKAYYNATSTEKQTEMYNSWKSKWLDKSEAAKDLKYQEPIGERKKIK